MNGYCGPVCEMEKRCGRAKRVAHLLKIVAFKLVRNGPREAVFENPEHDFPQRIIYRLESDGALFARIEGVVSGKEKGRNFPMKRGACE